MTQHKTEVDEVRQALKEYCAQLYQAFDWYCADGVAADATKPVDEENDDFYQIDLPSFIQFCRDARITDEETCTEEAITETFEWANKENSADLQDKLALGLG